MFASETYGVRGQGRGGEEERETERGRQTDRRTVRQTDGPTDRQTGQTDRRTDRERERASEIGKICRQLAASAFGCSACRTPEREGRHAEAYHTPLPALLKA